MCVSTIKWGSMTSDWQKSNNFILNYNFIHEISLFIYFFYLIWKTCGGFFRAKFSKSGRSRKCGQWKQKTRNDENNGIGFPWIQAEIWWILSEHCWMDWSSMLWRHQRSPKIKPNIVRENWKGKRGETSGSVAAPEVSVAFSHCITTNDSFSQDDIFFYLFVFVV